MGTFVKWQKKKNHILIFLSHARTNEQSWGNFGSKEHPQTTWLTPPVGFHNVPKGQRPQTTAASRRQWRKWDIRLSSHTSYSLFYWLHKSLFHCWLVHQRSFLENYALPVALTQISPCSATILVHLPGVWQEERTNPLQLRSTQDFFLFPRRSFPLATVTLGLLMSALGGLSGAWAQKAGKVLSECFPL